MSNVPLPEPHHQSAANFNAPDEPFYTADQMHAHAAAVSAAKDAEISGLQNFKTMHLEMVAKWAGDIGEALGEPSEDFKPDDLIALAGKVKIQRDALRADNIRLQNEVVMPLRERVRVLEDALDEVLAFQSAPKQPTIHDWGRWRRIRAALEQKP